jgi:hypothetical protein
VSCAFVGLINRPSRIAIKHVPEHAPTADQASGCRCVAPSGRSAAAYGPSRRLQTCLPRRVSSWWSCRYIGSPPAATLPLRGVASCARSSSPSPHTDVLGYRCAASHGAGRHVRARSSSTAGFFLAYFVYRRRASSRNLHGLHRRWFRRLHLHPRPV